MNKNSKAKARLLRSKSVNGFRSGQTFLAAQADAIAEGRSRLPVWMQFTDKWESNNSFRLFGL